jgi:hypothetical protein
MFEEPEGEVLDLDEIPPLPKIVILDLTLVTGMDTSAVDAFADIVSVCTTKNDCRVFMAGVATSLREIMMLNGLKPELTRDRSKRHLRFFQDLESAIGKAEDSLIDILSFNQNRVPRRTSRNGFVNTLCLIDGKEKIYIGCERRKTNQISRTTWPGLRKHSQGPSQLCEGSSFATRRIERRP